MSKWKLIKDDAAHWHYEELPRQCCEFANEEKECPDCSLEQGEQVRWHAAPYCPFCRGEGELINGTKINGGDLLDNPQDG